MIVCHLLRYGVIYAKHPPLTHAASVGAFAARKTLVALVIKQVKVLAIEVILLCSIQYGRCTAQHVSPAWHRHTKAAQPKGRPPM